MTDDLKKQIDAKQGTQGFIKVTDLPVEGLSDQQKVALNRKANTLFNEGKFDMAERIFITTGYSDGLSRIADRYAEKKEYLKAIRLYSLAHNKRKLNPLIEKVSDVISVMIKE
ncbi:MAG: hypothetical protein SO116_09085 [Treponema sp.]|nr:hypothetical protein [Spirochaetia bacterium]MDD7014809.1 hypothetical protein [Spirochaetales bacterium]MDY4903005.1 hypothetical protein [Treponema sp.]